MKYMLLIYSDEHAAKPLPLGFSPLGQHYSNIAARLKRVETIPGYDKTYPPHWRQ